jgi:hypothetical protein
MGNNPGSLDPKSFLKMLRGQSARHIVIVCLLAAFITFGIQLSLHWIDAAALSVDGLTDSHLLRLLVVFQIATGDPFPSDILVFIGVLVLLSLFLQVEKAQCFSIRTLLLALFFTLFACAGKMLSGDVGFSYTDPYILARALVFAIAFMLLCYCALTVLEALLKRYLEKTKSWSSEEATEETPAAQHGRFTELVFFQRPFLAPFLLILLCWLPYLIICYPGTTDPYDVLDQLSQYHGIAFRTPLWINLVDPNILLNNHHPVFHTVLVSLFVDFGASIGNQSLGFFLYVLLQFLALAGALAAAVSYLRAFNTPLIVRKLILLGICLIPLFPAWAISVTKDVPFTALVVLYIIFLMRAVMDSQQFRQNKRLLVGFFLVCLLMTLVRNNGMHLIILSAPFLFLLKGKWVKLVATSALASVLCFLLYSNFLLPALGVSGGSIKEVLSIPIQQTACYVRAYPNEVTSEEKAAIGRILPYDEIAEAYDPRKADNVKDRYFKDANGEDLLVYLRTWFSMGLKHPVIYVAATVSNCSSYFYPGADTNWVWMNLNDYGRYDQLSLEQEYRDDGFELNQIAAFEPARNLLREGFMLFQKTPFAYLVSIGTCAWVLMFMGIVLWKYRAGRVLIPFTPALALLLICMASPLDGSIRYALPYVSATPFLVAFACAMLKEKLRQQ